MSTYARLNRPIVVVPYDPRWPALYEEERARIAAALARRAATLEHFGSTAIPGLAAKPVIDIALGVPRLADAEAYLAALQALGYTYEPALEAALPDRRFLWRVTSDGQRYHVNLTEAGGANWRATLAFRDELRRHPAAAAEYARLKEALAARHGSDVGAYIDGKTAFVEKILAAARPKEA
jgi:GrpB-like predicted nucleotidyltransferase (UPF0157 family)